MRKERELKLWHLIVSLTVAVLFIFGLHSCAKQERPPKPTKTGQETGSCYSTNIDGCEYIYCSSFNGNIAITPKLNQSNRILCGGK